MLNVPMGIGIRIGSRGPSTLEIGMYVDLCCKQSKSMLKTVFGRVYPQLLERGKDVAFIVYHSPQPWAGSLALNEVAVAVRQVAPEKYVDFCLTVLDAQHRFAPSALYTTSRAQVHLSAAQLAESVGVDADKVMRELRLNANGENRVAPKIRASSLLAIQNGVRATPTATVNGLIDHVIFYDWSSSEWIDYLEEF